MFPKNYSFPFEIDKLTHLLPYLLDGIGYTFLPRTLVQKHLEEGLLTAIPLLDFEAPTIQNHIVVPESKLDDHALNLFLESVGVSTEDTV